MSPRKQELRKIILDIVFGRERVGYEPSQFAYLASGVAEVISRRVPKPSTSTAIFLHEPRLDHNDELLVQEIFWDLVIEKVLTIGSDVSNTQFPWFRLHSEAQLNLDHRQTGSKS